MNVVPIHLIGAKGSGALWCGDWIAFFGEIQDVSMPNNMSDGCFLRCRSLRPVTFGPCSLLERISVSCFQETGVEEVFVPDCVRELCDG